MSFQINKESSGRAAGEFAPSAAVVLTVLLSFLLGSCGYAEDQSGFYTGVYTIAGKHREFGEPFGIAVRNGETFVSDGDSGRILKLSKNGQVSEFASGLDTPSGIIFDSNGNLLVADSGSHTIKRIDEKGNIDNLAGVDHVSGFADGPAGQSLFNAPVGLAAGHDGIIFIADTYNDRIRVVENGVVKTLAGGTRGFANGGSSDARFDTPLGIGIWNGDKLLVADSGNRRIRVVDPEGIVWTLAGSGDGEPRDGMPGEAGFVFPMAVTVNDKGIIFIADGNTIRMLGGEAFPLVETISNKHAGLIDGRPSIARFNRPSGLAVNDMGELLVADSDNLLVRVFTHRADLPPITSGEIQELRYTAAEFRELQPSRWPFDPPERTREIAGTLGEIRGEIIDDSSQARFHNGLDIPGGYGETARFIRAEKVLHPAAVENFATLRELIRMPTIGYIHVRLGRNKDDKLLNDNSFQFELNNDKPVGVRVPRGTRFNAGEAIGTLNEMNHVHLIAGRSGSEMNALDALLLPGISDTIAPTIELVAVYDWNWSEIETDSATGRIRIDGKTRIVVRAFDRKNGNAERRRLAPYRIGYSVFKDGESPAPVAKWNISFERMPPMEAVGFVYARGSRSGATGETIFNFIATNYVDGVNYREDFLDPETLAAGNFTVRIHVSDFFGNDAIKDILIEVVK